MFSITPRIAYLIKLQRTGMKKLPNEAVAKPYYDSCTADLVSFNSYLPKKATSILDIGAGMGGIDILLHNKYDANTVLLDADRIDTDITYGFSEQASAYSIKKDVKEFMLMNGVPKESFLCVKIFPAPSHKYDIILSLISCGFHYPVSTYLNNIVSGLKPEGIVILDIRKDAGQFDELHSAFNFVDTIQNSKKYKRVICRNVKP